MSRNLIDEKQELNIRDTFIFCHQNDDNTKNIGYFQTNTGAVLRYEVRNVPS